ncbi:MAG: tRNA lysidine(34) synthetase TilS [Oscillospiraceae bacterium]|jgi:tRNA(Ile)-lysidine synthase|nr:tRNA lysidine(34) synthetase TilS [Oscillospiraceae bacterium]
MYSTIKRVDKYIAFSNLMPDSERKLSCAVSGGADSMCMLDIMVRLSANYDFSIEVLHFNHKIRGKESDRDERFVRDYCRENNLKLTVSYPNNLLDGSENAAREARYTFFEKNASIVATAHNSDDNAETMIANLARGTGGNGLRGIAPKLTRASGLTVIRPILCLTRREVMQYLEYSGISHIEDSSNADTRYSRNLIRAAVMPVLRRINPKIAEHSLAAGKYLAEDEHCLRGLAEAFLHNCGFTVENPKLPRKEINVLAPAIASRVIMLAAEAFGVSLFREHIDGALELSRSGKGGLIMTFPK